jgi:hypothetical protein
VKGMASLKSFISFWATFPGVLTGAAVLLIAITGVVVMISVRQTATPSLPCTEFQRGHGDRVACNSATQSGYFWSLLSKTEHYSVEGVSPVGEEPRCGPETVGSRAMSARFPLQDAAFLPVRDSYENKVADLTAPGCNFSRAGDQMTDRDLGAICGLFAFECKEQPH